MLKDRMEKLMKGLKEMKHVKSTAEYDWGYADGCLDMFNEAVREYEEVFAEQTGGMNESKG